MLRLMLLSLTAFAVVGCTVVPPSVRVTPAVVQPAVVVHPAPVVVEGGGGRRHCPPGQAKKGNC